MGKIEDKNIKNEEKTNEDLKQNSSNENKMNKYSKNTKPIPKDLREFFNRNYLVFIGGSGAPKEFSSLGDGFKGERNVTQKDIDSFSPETLFYLSQFKNPDFILKNFRAGSINFYQL